MKNLALHWKIIIGLVLGVIWALLSAIFGFSEFTIDWVKPFGDIFIRLLKLIAVPLVLFSLIKGVSGLSDIAKLSRLGRKTVLIYLSTTVFSVLIGLTLVNTIQPGNFISKETRDLNKEKYAHKIEAKKADAKEFKESGPLTFLVDIVPSNIFFSLQNNKLMLQVIFFAVLFGIALVLIPGEIGQPVKALVDGVNEVILKIVFIIMDAAPFFVFALMAGLIADIAGDNLSTAVDLFKGLGVYSLTVLTGLGILAFIFYPLLLRMFTKMNYGFFFKGISAAQTLAFSTSSSAATLPVTMECVNKNLGVSKEVTSFVLPIGATVNMDGTSCYQAIAAVFLAQAFGVDLDLGQQITIVLTATLASIGSPAVPSAGLVMLMIVLESIGLDPAWIGIIFPVDRILDMCRTVVNVTGDSAVATIVDHSEAKTQ
ncbi:MAG: dicarboxylate/amino acid:cation symporter [Bacteroidetes bacterium]|nr:dicarboxylate/amino acid:cation symporter [Bacteroidia bacterium]PCH68566.1 MAG: dicarboxylate/amino acid:cation symporter [Bacteroidota bacterium]